MAESAVKRIGVLTSGGDAPGMNAAVRSVVRSALDRGIECIGIRRGWSGLVNGDFYRMDSGSVSRIINRGGTILYTARSEEFRTAEGQAKAAGVCKLLGLDGIVAIGGDGTFRGAVDLTDAGIPCIGIPGTIDNDIASTDMTIGFDTAMNTVVELVDKLRDTGESHARCNVVEVMGREAGDIALNTSIAAGAVTAVRQTARQSAVSAESAFFIVFFMLFPFLCFFCEAFFSSGRIHAAAFSMPCKRRFYAFRLKYSHMLAILLPLLCGRASGFRGGKKENLQCIRRFFRAAG